MAAKRIKPNQSFSMEQDGFFGEYYKAKDNAFPGKCIIAFGGSVGKFLLSQMMAWENWSVNGLPVSTGFFPERDCFADSEH